MTHFNWLEFVVSHEYVHVATFFVSCVLGVLLCFLGRRALDKSPGIAPSSSFGIRGFFETVVFFIASLCEMVMEKKGKRFVSLFATLFFIIFVNNLVGLIPGMTPATDNLNTTVAVGLFSFLVYNIYGFREHGISYGKQFLGPLLVLAPLMVIIELISHIVRPLSLGLRLYGNMMGDHTILNIFLHLTPYVIPVIFYGLGLFVCFMQAFIFTILSIIYVSMAVSHDH